MEEMIDILDLFLEKMVEEDVLALSDLKPDGVGARAATKHARRIAMAIEEQSAKSSRLVNGPKGGVDNTDVFASLTRVMTASTNPRVSASDELIIEELNASQARVELVAKDPLAMSTLAVLAKLLESGESEAKKLKVYSQVANKHSSIAELLKASNVREPRGEFLALCPNSETCVRLARVCKGGVKVAAKTLMRKFFPPSADPESLVEAVLAGQLLGDEACSVAHLATPTKAKKWLGVAAAAAFPRIPLCHT